MINFYLFYRYGTILDLHDQYNFKLRKLQNCICPIYDWTKIIHIIKKSPQLSYEYSVMIIKCRWFEAEACICTDEVIWEEYKWYFNLQ